MVFHQKVYPVHHMAIYFQVSIHYVQLTVAQRLQIFFYLLLIQVILQLLKTTQTVMQVNLKNGNESLRKEVPRIVQQMCQIIKKGSVEKGRKTKNLMMINGNTVNLVITLLSFKKLLILHFLAQLYNQLSVT
ncbi:uncharacterized protein LOC124453802 [Xenia sp. Carnegie-2017]|uniref:uncharacterized protein LOC124453802 n=1 Tax=Xenia sp. Carnegie-2017 TaxID=2897299 RepID=UPI001F03F6A2|nr:uncharacterized protein LOC124453802 [Xenia sp. Carnegie-2017]